MIQSQKWREHTLLRFGGKCYLLSAGSCRSTVNPQQFALPFRPKQREKERMVGPPFDCLANPLGAVRLTFEKAVASGSDPATLDGKDWGATDLFREFLLEKGGLSQVPILDPTNIRWIQPNSLVRFRGMVQDMLGNEFYVGAFKDGSAWRTNKFMDVASYPICSSTETRIWGRRILYCVSVPGRNSWTESSPSESVIDRHRKWTSQHGEKRRREDNAAIDKMDLNASDHEDKASLCTKKMRGGGLPSQSSQPQESVTEGSCSDINMVSDFGSNSLPCIVKIYDSPESDLKLNEVCEFVGVFTSDPEFRVLNDDSDEFSDGLCEDVLVHLPSNKVPLLHCFIYQKLAVGDFLHNSPMIETKPNLVREIRESLLGHLSAVLGNDGVAAHCMLLHLLSRVHTRVATAALGKLSLNLTGLTTESVSVFGNQLKFAIQSLLPFTQCTPLTVEYLNTASLAPRKNYQSNRLVTGDLQLAIGTHLIIDETQLKAGTLNSVGVDNARLLKNLAELQKVEYDFKYYKMDMSVDVQLLILSDGKSNILPADLVLPFHPSTVGSSDIGGGEALQAWRWYLATLRSLPHSIEPDMQKAIEDDLVAARQADRSLGSQDFSRLLTMARMMSASFGETSLSLEHWQMVKELDRLRRERLK